MSTAIVLFTRDLRVHDNPALSSAIQDADRVVPLFVLDDRIADAGYVAPNRARFLVDSLRDLDRSLQARGGALVVRRGDVIEEVAALARQVDASGVHVAGDVSRFALRREEDLRDALAAQAVDLHVHAGVTVIPPGDLRTTSGGTYRVFTPYWKVWSDAPVRPVLDAPAAVSLPDGLDRGEVPEPDALATGAPSPQLLPGGEAAARQRLDAWLSGGIDDYEDGRDRLAEDGTSKLSPYLHFGNLSPVELAARLDRRRRGHDAFLRQLCWRDFHHQVTWSHPRMAVDELRTQGDRWNTDPAGEDFTAWKEGRTGYPIVDAAMRQLASEGWMHNRARMIAASFLVKDLYVDWRLGADHFLYWLVDGDIANNSANWQWVAGTGTDSRPNRVYNPTRQADRYDPDARYVDRYLPDRGGPDDPAPLVDHAEAVARFRNARGLE